MMGLPFDLPLATARGARARLLVTVPKATDALQMARARQKIDRVGTGFAAADDAFAATQRPLA